MVGRGHLSFSASPAFRCSSLCAWFSCFAGATVVSFSGLVGSVSSSAGRKPTPIAAVLSFVLGGLVIGAIGLTSMGLGGTVVILLNVVLIWAVAVCVGGNLLKEVEGSRHAQRRFHVAVLVGFGMTEARRRLKACVSRT